MLLDIVGVMPSMKEKKVNIKLGFGRLKPEFFYYMLLRKKMKIYIKDFDVFYINISKEKIKCIS